MGPAGRRPEGSQRILIAEDSRTQAEHLRAVLEDGGYIVEVAADGAQGLTAARARQPDLIISDVNMPEMDGYEFCRAIKSDESLKSTPFMLVTSMTSPSDVVHGLEAGADNFITKPYDETTLLERVRYLLTNSALRGSSRVRAGIELDLGGKVHFITAERHQILDLLISTYAEAVRLSEEAVKRGEQLRQSYETMAVLHRSAEGLNKVHTEDEVVAETLQRVQDLPFCRAGWIMLTDDDGMVRIVRTGGLAEAQAAAIGGASICACQRDLHLGKFTGATQIADCARLGRGPSADGRSGHASIALIGQQRVFGVLNAIPREDRPFTPDELRVLSALGNQVTAAMDRAYLNSTLERQVATRTEELRREVAVRQRAESVAIAAAVRLERAQRVGQVGSAERNLATGENHWSDEMYRILGFAPRTIPASYERMLEATHPDDRAKYAEAHQRTRRGEPADIMEFRIIRPDGEIRTLQRMAERTLDSNGNATSITATFRDITLQKRMEEEIVRSRKHLDQAQRLGKIGSAEFHLPTGAVYWSDEMFRLFGLEIGSRPPDFERLLTLIHPDDRERFTALNTRLYAGQVDAPWEFRVLLSDGHVRWIARDVKIVDKENGKPTTLLVTNQDVTARQEVEEQLRQSQKMEAVGNLTGGIAHDFNNILAVVIGNLDLLKLELPEGTETSELVDTGIAACVKGSELTQSLLAFSRRQPLQPKRIEINKLLRDGVKMLSRAIGESVQVQLRLGDGLWEVMVDPAQLESALLNMMVNSRDAMPGGGHILIETRNTTLDDDYASSNAEVTAGPYVLLEVSDTGTGMPPEILRRVFEPFFTTKEKGKGTGLGLAMVFGFVKQSGGHIKIYSEVGHGTTIRVYLPKASGAGAVSELVEAARPIAKPQNEMILVVEDNPAVRRGVVKQLTAAGYRVTEAEHAGQAVDLLEAGTPVDLVFSDVIMPGGMTGADLAREARERWPTLKVLLTSGFPEGLLENGNKLPAGVNLLSKPYRMEELYRKLREVLGG